MYSLIQVKRDRQDGVLGTPGTGDGGTSRSMTISPSNADSTSGTSDSMQLDVSNSLSTQLLDEISVKGSLGESYGKMAAAAYFYEEHATFGPVVDQSVFSIRRDMNFTDHRRREVFPIDISRRLDRIFIRQQ